MITEYVPHIIKNASKQHIVAFIGTAGEGSFLVCSEEKCEINKCYDQYSSDKGDSK